MPKPPTRSRFPWQTLVIVALTVGLLWLFFRNVDLKQAWAAVLRAHPGFIAAAIVVVLATYVVRSIRWIVLLRPLGHARFRTAFRTTVIGFAATFLLPGRVGEVLRPYLLAKQEGMNPASTFATIIVERLLDMVTVLLLFALALPLAGVDVGKDVQLAGVGLAVMALAGLAVMFFLAGHPDRLGKWAGRLSSRLPVKAASTVAHLAQTFAEGLQVMRSPGQFALASCWSVALWAVIALGIWLTSQAFDLTFSYIGSFLVVGCLAVGVTLPTPGGAGGFHGAYLLALTQFYHANPSTAAAAAIVLHAVSFVPVTILGLVFMWQDGLSLGRLKQMKSGAQAAEQSGNGPVAGPAVRPR